MNGADAACRAVPNKGIEMIDAGWYDDPTQVGTRLRYYDGQEWTEHVQAYPEGVQPTQAVQAVQEPVYIAPVVAPVYVAPVVVVPVIQEPVYVAPVVVVPVVEEPVYVAPVVVVEEPVYVAPVEVAPIIEEPVYVAPVVGVPVVGEPVYVAPVEVVPVIEEVQYEEPKKIKVAKPKKIKVAKPKKIKVVKEKKEKSGSRKKIYIATFVTIQMLFVGGLLINNTLGQKAVVDKPAIEVVVPTAKPVVPTAKPEVPTAKPVVPTAKPVVPTAKPEVPTAKPASSSIRTFNASISTFCSVNRAALSSDGPDYATALKSRSVAFNKLAGLVTLGLSKLSTSDREAVSSALLRSANVASSIYSAANAQSVSNPDDALLYFKDASEEASVVMSEFKSYASKNAIACNGLL